MVDAWDAWEWKCSDTEYLFREDQADAIVRVTAYRNKRFDRSVIWFSPRQHAGIRPSIATPFPRTPEPAALGPLARLPLDLWLEIMPRLDMQSIFNLRQADLRSRQMVDSVHAYQMVATHGLNLLCALLRTRLAAGVSLSEFYNLLCTKACRYHCDKPGVFVSLLAWERFCNDCDAMAIGVQSLARIRKQFNLTDAEAGQLKSFETLPGTYRMFGARDEIVQSSRVVVASPQQAASLRGSTITRETEYMVVLRGLVPPEQDFCVMASCALPYYDKQTDRVEHWVLCAGCFDVHCKRTTKISDYNARERTAHRIIYMRDAFLEHFKWCKQAQILWRWSGEGKSMPDELSKLSWSGHFGEDADREDSELADQE